MSSGLLGAPVKGMHMNCSDSFDFYKMTRIHSGSLARSSKRWNLLSFFIRLFLPLHIHIIPLFYLFIIDLPFLLHVQMTWIILMPHFVFMLPSECPITHSLTSTWWIDDIQPSVSSSLIACVHAILNHLGSHGHGIQYH